MDPIRTRPDGSIDTAHYIAEGRRLRARHARAMMRRDADRARLRAGALLSSAAALALIAVVPFVV